MKFYCTKYWTTHGIIEFEGTVGHTVPDIVNSVDAKWAIHEFLGREVFRTQEEAWARVEHKAGLLLQARERALAKARDFFCKAINKEIKVVKE